jgi:hypothetical membrane protein
MRVLFPELKENGTAGVMLFAGSLLVLFGMMLAEFSYPGYSMADNYISDLGSFTHPVPAVIFNVSITVFGAVGIYAGLLLRTSLDRWLGILVILAGAGAMGVGIFNEGTILAVHGISALMVFICGGIAMYRSARVLYKPPLSWIFFFMAGVVVWFIIFMIFDMAPGSPGGFTFGIGIGGMERMVVFPTLFWLLATGIYLVARPEAVVSGTTR